VITVRELQALSAEWALTPHVIDKDWALGWVLAGIGAEPELSTWVFKGGTSLRNPVRWGHQIAWHQKEGNPRRTSSPVGCRRTRWRAFGGQSRDCRCRSR
jgi:hypothetical protein